jgi:hypothetical protein
VGAVNALTALLGGSEPSKSRRYSASVCGILHGFLHGRGPTPRRYLYTVMTEHQGVTDSRIFDCVERIDVPGSINPTSSVKGLRLRGTLYLFSLQGLRARHERNGF